VTEVRADGDETVVAVAFTAMDDLGEHVGGTAEVALPRSPG